MGKKVIKVRLSTSSVDSAIKELTKYKQDLVVKEKMLLEKLAYIGVKEASVRFTTAMYDGINDSKVSLKNTKKGYKVIAKGKAVAFIEFGTGVYHNTGEPYPNPRPEGIVGIGEYGDGKGSRRAWYYKGSPGTNGEVQANGVVKTRGNPAAMPMWYASEDMRKSILKVVKEVFG